MHRILWEWSSVGVRLQSFSVMLAVACLAALWLTVWRARREGLSPDRVMELAVWLLTGGIVGARVLYVLTHPEAVRGPADFFRIWQGGIVYYGCLIGGLIGSTIYWYRRPFPFLATADVVAPALALGSAVGRVGCWLNGCCYGDPFPEPLGVAFPKGSIPWSRHVADGLIGPTALSSLPILPMQIVAAVEGLLLLALLSAYFPVRRRDGEVMALLMVSYPVSRFLIESLRGDEEAIVAGLTLSQGLSLAIFVGGLVSWALLRRRPLGTHANNERSSRRRARPAATPVHASIR